jgi:oligopeptidase A
MSLVCRILKVVSDNPLLHIHFEIPFDRVRAEHVEPAMAELLADARAKVEAIASDSAPRTYDNTLLALEKATERLDYAIGIVRHLEGVATYPELRSAFNAVEPLVSEFYSGIPLHAGLWKAIKALDETHPELTPARHRLLTKTVESFRRHGADLDDAGKKRLAEIDVALAKATTKFSENVLDSTNAFELIIEEEKDLAGLPPTARSAARASAESKGVNGWRFTLQAPSYQPLMTYLDNREIREKVYRAYSTRASSGEYDNSVLTADILKLRREKALLLGFRDFADLVLEDRMAKNGASAQAFLERLEARTENRFTIENQELRDFASFELEPWDVGYWAEKLRLKLYDFDEEALRPYFPMEKVVSGMFDIVGRLFGIRVVHKPAAHVWHPDVRYYEIRDEDGRLLGAFYADWYPRESKRGGAWMDAFIIGLYDPPQSEPHAGTICGNLTPPVGETPSLLTHREVETIFHEFGHLLHLVLSQIEVRSLGGTNVAWDFVELPSQIMENWCWEREALNLFARHYQTGEPIPEDLFQKMRRARTFRGANAQMRQLSFGIVDLKLHREYSPERDGDVIPYSRHILQKFSAVRLPEDHAMIASFTHLFASPVAYGAGYYSYKWAEVLDADAFSLFLEHGIFSREIGLQFRGNILSKGDSEDPAVLYRRFMGRDPDPEALLVRSGLA